MTDNEIVQAIRAANPSDAQWRELTHEVGPYDITEPRGFTRELVRLLADRPEVYACDDEMPLDPDAIRIQFNEWWASWNKAGLSGIDKEIAFDAFDAAAHLYKEAASSPLGTTQEKS